MPIGLTAWLQSIFQDITNVETKTYLSTNPTFYDFKYYKEPRFLQTDTTGGDGVILDNPRGGPSLLVTFATGWNGMRAANLQARFYPNSADFGIFMRYPTVIGEDDALWVAGLPPEVFPLVMPPGSRLSIVDDAWQVGDDDDFYIQFYEVYV